MKYDEGSVKLKKVTSLIKTISNIYVYVTANTGKHIVDAIQSHGDVASLTATNWTKKKKYFLDSGKVL